MIVPIAVGMSQFSYHKVPRVSYSYGINHLLPLYIIQATAFLTRPVAFICMHYTQYENVNGVYWSKMNSQQTPHVAP